MFSGASTREKAPPRPPQRSLLGWVATTPLKVVMWLLLSLLFSVMQQWVAMSIWPSAGPAHARHMLNTEIGYLNQDFRQSLITASPGRFVGDIADTAYEVLVKWTGLGSLMTTLGAANSPGDSVLMRTGRAIYQPAAAYLIAGVTTTQTFAVRLGVLILASPVFVLAALVGLTDGLVERDRRRFGGAREKGLVFHNAKQWAPLFLIGPWVIYLSLPFSLNPDLVILPSAALFGMSLAVIAGTFKKYL